MARYGFFLVLSFVVNAGSYIFYKYSSLQGGKPVVAALLLAAGLALGAVNAFFYTKSLKGISLNVAYPIFSAFSIVLVTLISVLLFQEGLGPRRIAGIGVILVGVLLTTSG